MLRRVCVCERCSRRAEMADVCTNTERLQHERQQALEQMGISVQASGIMVEKNKYYLVNLNADPSLNELLVYYLKVCVKCDSFHCVVNGITFTC